MSYTNMIGGRMQERYLDDGYTTHPCTVLESLDYSYSYHGYLSKEVRELYPQEEHLAELLLNASSAVKLEFNFRPKRFQLMTHGKKYTWEAMIGNAGIKINLYIKTVYYNIILALVIIVCIESLLYRWMVGDIPWILTSQFPSTGRNLHEIIEIFL